MYTNHLKSLNTKIMKTFFSITLMFMLFAYTIPSYADTSPNLVDQVANTMSIALDSAKATATTVDSSSITKMVYMDIKNGLSVVGQGATKGLSAIFDIYSNYYFWMGVTNIISCILMGSIGAILLYKIRHKDSDSTEFVFGIIVGGFMLITSFFFLILGNDILKICVPEYYVVQDLLKLIQ